MKNVFAILLLTIFYGCAKDEDLDKNFKNVLIAYQKKFPTPTDSKPNRKRIYVYSVYFWQNKKDTLLFLSRSSGGVSKVIKGYGIYQDDKLKPTFIVDKSNLSSNLIINRITNINGKFYWKEKSFPESTPPVFTYLVKNKELRLINIDTVWNNWD